MNKWICLLLTSTLIATMGERASASEAQLGTKARLAPPNGNGEVLKTVNIVPSSLEDVEASEEAAPRDTRDMLNLLDFRGWHLPKARKLIKVLEHEYGVQAIGMTSYLATSFTAYMTRSAAEKLRADPRIEDVVDVYEALDFRAWSDQQINGEWIPWGKTAIGTNDSATTSNIVYMIDGLSPGHNDLPGNLMPSNANPPPIPPTFPDHATFVAGVLGAAINNQFVRGINSQAPILNINRGTTDNQINTAMDWAFADAESRGIFAIANISSNSDRWAAGHASGLAARMNKLSSRLFIAQSAGNGDVTTNPQLRYDACTVSYSPPWDRDGIMVVGGTDELGAQALVYTNTGSPFASQWGSNYGNCIEVWGPSRAVRSLRSNPANEQTVAGGTSFAAPHIAALAARYGGTSTRPPQREAYIRSKWFNTGYSDQSGATIRMASFTQPPSFTVPNKLAPVAITADSFLAGYPPSLANDGKYLNQFVWNAGHGAPAWIEFDLGFVRTLDSIRMAAAMSSTGAIAHSIRAGNTPNPPTTLYNFTGQASDYQVFSINLQGATARYVRISTTTMPGWVSWREVEIFGY